MIFGYKDYIITGDSFSRFYRRIGNDDIPVRNMCEKDGKVSLRLSAEYCKALESLCNELGLEYTTIRQRGAVRIFKKLLSRPGMIAGVLVVLCAGFYLSNIAVRFDILSDDENIKKGVMNVLKAEGIEAGCYIPNIDLVVTERALKQNVEGISWAGITRKGNTLIIDVIETEGGEKREANRYPSNLVACEDGVIESVSVYDGQLLVPVGSGVTKGDIVISGEIITSKSSWIDGKENIETKTSYARSKGSVIGTFERTVTFEQPFSDSIETDTGKTDTKRYFSFYDADIPLFLSKPDGFWRSEQSYCPLELFGFELPFGIKSLSLTEYDFEKHNYSEAEALDIVHDKAYHYERNFLSGYEIKYRQAEDTVTDTGVKTTVTYTLKGEMCKEVEFFIRK